MANARAHVAGYVRVSSRSQSDTMQRAAIERAAAARGDAIATWYADRMTGGRLDRPELVRCRRDVRAGSVGRLYVWRLDRLTRSGIRDTLDVVEELGRCGCELVTIADGFDVGGPAAPIVLAVLAWAAQAERLAINERIAAARTRVEGEGGRWGRPRQRLSDDQVAHLRELAAAGRPIREIATKVGATRSTVHRFLQAETAGGEGPGLSQKDGPEPH